MEDPSIYVKVNIEGTRTIINTAIAAGICRLIYMSSTRDIFNAYDVMNVNNSVWTLGPYVTLAPNAESILSAFSTPFDSHEIKFGGPFGILDFTGVYDKYKQMLSSPELQGTYERLHKVTRTQIITKQWLIDATESSQWRRNIEDLCAGLNSSGKTDIYNKLQSQYESFQWAMNTGSMDIQKKENSKSC
ncbi:hypothetical protein BKA82DRAFT_4020627 [Pisolithus tinctorius]|nr:hypothetical protein BKA82DRAFT_4020627 [Pisolithus tinctorius]